MLVQYFSVNRVCVCGRNEACHAPWAGDCSQFKASGQVNECTILRYVKQPIPADIRWEVWERDDFRCKSCGSRRWLTVDHICPEVRGGTIALENLQTLCKSCNCRKRDG